MAQDYTRQSSFSDGDTITASLFNDEYNQLVNAFAYSSTDATSTGHRHDGTAAQGGNIPKIGDLDFNNKIEVDSTNNRWGFYVEVSSAAVEQIRIQDGAIVPVTDNDIDLGSSSLEFKNLYIDGTATIDDLTVDASAVIGTTLTVGGASSFQGDVTLGNATADTLIVNALVNSSFVPEADSTWNLGSTSLYWANAYVDAVTTTGDVAIGGNLTVTGNATISGNLTFGDADTDSITLTADVASHITPDADDTYDLGSSTKEWRNLYIDGTANIDSLVADTADINAGTIDNTVIGGTTAAAGTFTTFTSTGIDDNATATRLTISNGFTEFDATNHYIKFNGSTDSLRVGTTSTGYAYFINDGPSAGTGNSGMAFYDNGAVELWSPAGDVITGNLRINSSGVVTIPSAVLTTADINGGTADGVTIGGSTPAAGTFTTFTSTGIDDNATGERLTITDSGIAIGNTGTNPTPINGSTAVHATASLGAEFIAGTNDTVISSGAFMGGYVFRNADSTGSPPHYAGMWAESADTSGNMNLYFAAGSTRYETGAAHLTIESNGNISATGDITLGDTIYARSNYQAFLKLKADQVGLAGTGGPHEWQLEADTSGNLSINYDKNGTATNDVVRITKGTSSSDVKLDLPSGGEANFSASSTDFGLRISDGGVGGKTIRLVNNGTAIFSHNQVQDVIDMSNASSVTVAGFTSTGIDDNATSTAITIDSSENTTFAGTITSGDITISEGTPLFRIQDSDGTNQYTQLTNSNGNTYFGSRNDTADGNILIGGYGDGFNEFARWAASGHLTQKNNLIVEGTFTSLGIDDNATSTAITIDASENVGIGETSPDYRLHVKESPANGAYSSTTNMEATTRFHSQESTTGSYTAIQLAANNGNAALGWWNIGTVSTSSNYDNHLVFQTRTGASTYEERMRVDSSGELLLYSGAIDLTDQEEPSLPVRIESTGTLGNGGAGYDSSLENNGQLQLNADSVLITDNSTFTSGFPTAWNLINNGFSWGLGSTEYFTIASNGAVSIGAPASQTTHELSVRASDSPRISIDDTNGTSTNVNAGLLLRYGTTNAGSFNYTNGADLNVTNFLTGDIIYETPTEHSFTINGTEELRITNTETSVFGTSGDIFTLVDTNLTASASNIGNIRIAFDDSAGTRVAYVGTANTGDFFVNNQYGSTKLTFAGSTKITTITQGINVTGSIGVNTTPSRSLHVNSGSEQVTSLFESAGASSYIDFANSTTAQGRSRIGAEGTDTLVFKTEGAEAMRIDANGRVGINYDNPDVPFCVGVNVGNVLAARFGTLGTAKAGDDVYIRLQGNNTANSNKYIDLRHLVDDGALTINGPTSSLNEMLRIDSDGIKFNGDTAAVNALDDYEEGTWTPSPDSGTVSAIDCIYTKIGNTVHVSGALANFSDYSTTSDINISGLPFTSASSSTAIGAVMYRDVSLSTIADLTAYVSSSSSVLRFYVSRNDGAAWTALQYNHFDSNLGDLYFSVTYRV